MKPEFCREWKYSEVHFHENNIMHFTLLKRNISAVVIIYIDTLFTENSKACKDGICLLRKIALKRFSKTYFSPSNIAKISDTLIDTL